jgi:hypothetical protein
MCIPHPVQVGFPHLLQSIRLHMFGSFGFAAF